MVVHESGRRGWRDVSPLSRRTRRSESEVVASDKVEFPEFSRRKEIRNLSLPPAGCGS